MAQLYCTGPAHIFIAPALDDPVSNLALEYLGTAENAPQIELSPEFEPVYNDVTGKKKPLDMMFQGEDALITAKLNRYNEDVYAELAARIATGLPRGGFGVYSIGALALTQGLGWQIGIQFPYNTAPAMAQGGMPPGYLFYLGVPIGPEILEIGTKPKSVSVRFYCWSVYDPDTQTWDLYNNTTSFPPPN